MYYRPDDERVGNQRPRICHVPPSVRSIGSDALELCAIAGLTLDDWQAWVLEQASGEQEDGRWSCFEVGLTVSRQNGKSELLVARLLNRHVSHQRKSRSTAATNSTQRSSYSADWSLRLKTHRRS